MLALPRRVLRMELPIVEHLVKKQDYTNYLECGAEAIRAQKKMKQQSLHHQQHPIFVKNLLSTNQ